MSNATETVVQITARQTQLARRRYWAARFGGTELRIRLAASGLRVAESHLESLCGSPAKAKAAELAYIESLATA